jgi:NADPH:quinone reductase-like Zn-dependent oxidoreductase
LFIASGITKPIPALGEALVKVKCFGINRMDLTQRNGQYEIPPQASKILGVEFSGIIEDLGDEAADSQTFKIGDEIFGLTYGGIRIRCSSEH